MTPGPGIYMEVRFPVYLSWDLPSQTALKQCENSPAHYMTALETKRPPTDAMTLGSALHVAFLEPELMPDVVVKWDGKTRAGKEWEEFRDHHAGKYILTSGMYENLVGMVRSLRRHAFVRDWVGRIEGVEVSAVGDVGGLLMKGRVDALTSDPLVDLKKVTSCDARTVRNAVVDFGYHIQAAIYEELFGREDFVLLCVESSPPFDVVPWRLTPEFRTRGVEKANKLIQTVLRCQESGEWPGRSPGRQAQDLEPPEWMAPQITLDGEEVF